MEDLLIADIGTVSVKERHAQNMYNEAKKRRNLPGQTICVLRNRLKHNLVRRIWQSNKLEQWVSIRTVELNRLGSILGC